MDNIRQAVERARAQKHSASGLASGTLPAVRRTESAASGHSSFTSSTGDVELNVGYLQSRRIVAYSGTDQRSRPYDMLRTQVLQSMGVGGWKVLGVTSPTPGCGKTLTAINLALSIARQPDQSVVLADLDLQKPQVGACLGLGAEYDGTLGVLQGRITLPSAIVSVRAGNQQLAVMPTAATRESSELMGSRTMRGLLQDLRKRYQSHIVLLDLPPILSSDDVIAILPQIDCMLLVTAVGLSKVSEVEECKRHLQSSHIVRVVVNKTVDEHSSYYYY
jgi:protein-tyrosine kinase